MIAEGINPQEAVVWITGATGGLGRETAMTCAARGARLVLSARNEASLKTVAAECESAGAGGVLIRNFDIREAPEIARTVELALGAYGRLDGFVATAADVPVGDLETLTRAQWEYGIANKLLSTVECLRAVLPVMRAQRRGRAVIVAGSRGTEPRPQQLLPGAVNAALNNIVKALSTDFIRYGVAINTVSPALVMTRRLEVYVEDGAKKSGKTADEVRAGFLEDLPAARFLRASEIGTVICELLFAFPESYTGQTVLVDAAESRGVR